METMTAMKDTTIEGLQDLIEINTDSAAGFRTAADNVGEPRVAALFRDLAQERQAFAGELKGYVKLNGEQPDDDGSWKAKMHRWWIDMRTNVSGDDLKVVLEEAERGEDKIKACYEETIKETTGNPVNDVLHRQYAKVKATHDRIRDARDLVKQIS